MRAMPPKANPADERHGSDHLNAGEPILGIRPQDTRRERPAVITAVSNANPVSRIGPVHRVPDGLRARERAVAGNALLQSGNHEMG